MIAVATVDLVSGVLIAIGAALWLIVDGLKDRARSRPPVAASTAGLPDTPRRACQVEAGSIAADTVEALSFPGPYNRGAVKR